MYANGNYGYSNSNTIEFSVPKDSYVYYSINNAYSGGFTYVPTPSSGGIYAYSSGETVYINFVQEITIYFKEKNLPGGTYWSMSVDGTSNGGYTQWNGQSNELSFLVPKGEYFIYSIDPAYSGGTTYKAVPSSGSYYAGYNGEVFYAVFYPVIWIHFKESGLPQGTYWSMTAGGAYNGTRTNELGFQVVKDSWFSFTVYEATASNGLTYVGEPSSGSEYASYAGEVYMIKFVPIYGIKFVETGLPSGVQWWVILNGTYNSTDAPNPIGFKEVSNQSYYFTVKTNFWYQGVYYVANPNASYVYIYKNN